MDYVEHPNYKQREFNSLEEKINYIIDIRLGVEKTDLGKKPYQKQHDKEG